MRFIENNPKFQAWAGEHVHEYETGTRVYGDLGQPSVWINDDTTHLDVSVFMLDYQTDPDGAGKRAGEWFGQFFTTDPDLGVDEGLEWEAGW